MAPPADTAVPEGAPEASSHQTPSEIESFAPVTRQPGSENEESEGTSVRAAEQRSVQDGIETNADHASQAQDTQHEAPADGESEQGHVTISGPRGIGGNVINGSINHGFNCFSNIVFQFLAAVMAYYSLDQYFGELSEICEALIVHLEVDDRFEESSPRLPELVQKIRDAVAHCLAKGDLHEISIAKRLRNLSEDMRNPNERPVSPLVFLQVFAMTDDTRSQYDGCRTGFFTGFWEALNKALDIKDRVDDTHCLPDLFRMIVSHRFYCPKNCSSADNTPYKTKVAD